MRVLRHIMSIAIAAAVLQVQAQVLPEFNMMDTTVTDNENIAVVTNDAR